MTCSISGFPTGSPSPAGVLHRGRLEGATGRFAHLDADGARIELVEYGPEGEGRSAASVNRPGAKHLGLAVADLDAFHDGLPEDVETVSEPRTTGSGTRILFIRYPEDDLVEVIES